MKKILFIDRDGTLIQEPPVTFQVDTLEQLSFLPGVIRNLYRIVTELQYELVMVTNQDGLGTPAYPEAPFYKVQDKMLEVLAGEGIQFTAIHIDRSFAHESRDTRKPGIGLLQSYLAGPYNLAQSYVIGDRSTDMELAQNLGTQSIFLNNTMPDPPLPADLVTDNWDAIYHYLKRNQRRIEYGRVTHETNIRLTLHLDGNGQYNIHTGLGFFDHMLEQLVKHSGIDLTLHVKGDLHIDEHHTVEDTGIALGKAVATALGEKRGIERYGFCLPMDDCLAQVCLDFGGRPYLVWNASFKREKIGDMPTELFSHFFKSFSDAAQCNVYIKAEGVNEHHKIEAIFKAMAKSIKMAVAFTGDPDSLPTTKGML